MSIAPSSKSNKSRSSQNRNGKGRNSGAGTQQPTRELRVLPVRTNPVTKIRRSVSRVFTLNAATGIDGYPYYDMQLVFNIGSVNWRIGGTSIYTDVLPNVTELTSLFDQWRLRSVVVRVDVPLGLSNSLASASISPLVMYAPDYDDSGSAVKADLLQYPQMKVHSFLKDGYTPLMFEFHPKPLRDIAGSGVSTVYGPMSYAPWIRTSETTTPHYGIKMFFDFMGTAANVSTPLEFTIFTDIELTNPK